MGNPKGYRAPKGERGKYLPIDPVIRLRAKFVEGSADECWPWLAGIDRKLGYGIFWNGRANVAAHRSVYELLVGPIPEGMQLDHLCHNRDAECVSGSLCLHRRCVNPSHLEPVTPTENKMRGRSAPALNARKTHCPEGHPYSGENLLVRPDGNRRCRLCENARNRARSERRRAARLAESS